MRDINLIFSELAQYKRLQEETSAIIDTLTDEIKSIMTESGNYSIVGNEHRAQWSDVTQNRVDTKRLQVEKPEIYTAYCTPSTYKRFTFK